MENIQNTNQVAQLLVKIHSEFGCDWHVQEDPRPFYQAAKPPPVAPAAPASAKMPAKAPAPTEQEEAVLGAIEAQKLATAAAAEATSLAELKTAVQEFKGCESLSRTATGAVFSDGTEISDIMIIGEAPGRDEDLQGKPFVGQSGQLLDYMLSFIGLQRDKNFYITNTVFWRPPGNRTPTDNEMNICAPFVERHIALFQPKIILLVGNVSAKRFFESSDGITKIRGSWQEYGDNKIPMLATFHPAYLLRNPMAKKNVWQDLLSFQAKAKTLGLIK